MRYTLILILCLASVFMSCEGLNVTEVSEYPIKVQPLGLLELDNLNTIYQRENESLCSTLNEFGYTGFSRILFPNNVNPCNSKEIIRIELSDPDSLIVKAIDAVIKNSEYTNVSNPERLSLKETVPLYGCTICEGPQTNSVPLEWKMVFEAQTFDGLQVYNSEINVFVDAIGVNRIWGNWIPDFYAPGLLDVGYLEAEMKVIGETIDLNDFFGIDSSFVVTQEHLIEPSRLEIVPYQNVVGELEFRKAWKTTITFSENLNEQIIGHVDAIEGNLLQFVVNQEDDNKF